MPQSNAYKKGPPSGSRSPNKVNKDRFINRCARGGQGGNSPCFAKSVTPPGEKKTPPLKNLGTPHQKFGPWPKLKSGKVNFLTKTINFVPS